MQTKSEMINRIAELAKENAELKAENERLKEDIKTLEQFLSKEPLALQALQKGYASYKESTDVFYEMVKNYKQTLQEIKKECHWVSECGVTNDNMWGYDNILDLITKAEEE